MKLSLKKLKEQCYFLNMITSHENQKEFFITAFGRHMDTNEVISIEKHTDYFAQRSQANWRYHLVWGSNTHKK